MKNLFEKIASFLNTQDEIEKIDFVDEQMGLICYITMKSGEKLILSLMDSQLD